MYIAGYQLAPSTPVGFPWGQVFQARARDGRAVVLHIIGGMPDAPGFKEQLLTELRPLLRLSHPSLVPLLDIGLCDDGAAFIVTDTYPNTDIWEWLNPGPRQRRGPALHALSVIARACDGVGAVHRAGLIHGDLDPLRVRVDSGTNIEDVPCRRAVPVQHLCNKPGMCSLGEWRRVPTRRLTRYTVGKVPNFLGFSVPLLC